LSGLCIKQAPEEYLPPCAAENCGTQPTSTNAMDAIAAAIKVWGDRWCIDKTMQYVLRRRIKQLLQKHQ
jgi:hypothetical protein